MLQKPVLKKHLASLKQNYSKFSKKKQSCNSAMKWLSKTLSFEHQQTLKQIVKNNKHKSANKLQIHSIKNWT